MESATKFVDQKLKLRVNRKKSAVGRPWKRKFLGYSVTMNKKPLLRIAPQSVARLKSKIKDLFRSGRGRSVGTTIELLTPVLRGWYSYYRYAEVKGVFDSLDSWIRRRFRLIFWRQWKRPRTRVKRLIERGIRPGPSTGQCIQWSRALVELRRLAHEPRLPETLLRSSWLVQLSR